MFIGIDVGGTFTDGILLHEGKILSTAKHPTDANNLQSSIISVLDRLIRDRKLATSTGGLEHHFSHQSHRHGKRGSNSLGLDSGPVSMSGK